MKISLAIAMMAILFAFSAPVLAATVYVGVEDLFLCNSDKDYNDMVVRLTGANLSVTGFGSWQPMVTPNQDGTPFWDNTSADGGNQNVGYFMTGSGAFAGNPASPNIPVSQLSYWGVGTSPDQSFLFSAGPGGVSATIMIEVAGFSGQNALYWFNQTTPTVLNQLFSGPDGAGTVRSINPNGNFGLMLVGPGGAFRTTNNGQQYAVFSDSVPEPASFVLVGVGLLATGFFRRRHRRNE